MLRRKLRLVSLGGLLGALLVTSSVTAEGGINSWTSIGPEGGSIAALAIDPVTPGTLYAGTYDGGVFKSVSAGESWSAVNTGLPILYVRALAIDPQMPATLYAGTFGFAGVFKSTNAGGSWSASARFTIGDVLSLAIDPLMPTTVYAGTADGVFKSTNGGGSWSGVNTGLPNSPVQVVAIDPQTPTTLYSGTETSGVFKSTNGGGSWNAINTGLTNPDVIALAIDPQTPARLYAGTGGSGVFVFGGDNPQTAPTIGCVATPNTIWPPNGKRVVVTVSGTVTAGSQPIPAGGTTCAVKDEYGEVQPSGSFGLGPGGSYSFGVSLIAARNGDDQDGRTYTIVVSARDAIGNVGSCSTVVTVPHDHGR